MTIKINGESFKKTDFDPLDQFSRGMSELRTVKSEAIEWLDTDEYRNISKDAIENWCTKQHRWRHHHNLPFLKESKHLYEVYADRVETILRMCDESLDHLGIMSRLNEMSAIDLACSEGFIANHYLEKGLKAIDCFELSADGLERFKKIQAYKGLKRARLGKIDLALPDWSMFLEKTYDIVFALGIIYHLENPFLFARNLYEITDRVCILESDTPKFENGVRFRGGNGVIYLYEDQVTLQQGNVRKLLEMRCDSQALVEIMLASGFDEVVLLSPSQETDSKYYRSGQKSVLVCVKN